MKQFSQWIDQDESDSENVRKDEPAGEREGVRTPDASSAIHSTKDCWGGCTGSISKIVIADGNDPPGPL